MSASSEGVKRWRENTKKKLAEAFGSKCNRCDYNLCLDAMDLHHLGNKSFSIGKAMARPKKWSLLVEEAKKCILLCCRCHRELHAGCWDLKDIDLIKPDFKEEPIKTDNCPVCGKEVFGTITCSRSCAAVKRAKVDWPDKETLALLRKTLSREEIGNMLGVSEMAVRKREKKYGIYSPVF